MKNYSPNRITPSKSFYVNELKNSSKNLTKENNQLDFFENKLQKLMDINYNFFRPFFEGDDEGIAENYKFNTFKQDVDKEFDNSLEKISPTWLTKIISFLISIYERLIGIKIIKIFIELSKKTVYHFVKLIYSKKQLKTFKFFAFKSSP